MKFCVVLGSGGCREKNLPTTTSRQLFGVVFSTFCGQKNNLDFFSKKYFNIRTEKLHSIKAKKKKRKIRKYFILG